MLTQMQQPHQPYVPHMIVSQVAVDKQQQQQPQQPPQQQQQQQMQPQMQQQQMQQQQMQQYGGMQLHPMMQQQQQQQQQPQQQQQQPMQGVQGMQGMQGMHMPQGMQMQQQPVQQQMVMAQAPMQMQQFPQQVSPHQTHFAPVQQPPHSTPPLHSRSSPAQPGLEGEEGKQRRDSNDEEPLLPGLPTSDKPSCIHNRWMLIVKRKRFYIMECMVPQCKSLWKTKLKSTQKCSEFFSGHCPLDDKCPHPHVYSRSRLRQEQNEGEEGEEDEEDDGGLFQPRQVEKSPAAKPAAPVVGTASEKRATIHPLHINASTNRSMLSSQVPTPLQLVAQLESSRRVLMQMTWWSQLVSHMPQPLMTRGLVATPDWLDTAASREGVPETQRSTRSSMRLMRWNDFSGSFSGRSEPPELINLDGESLLAAACLTANPEELFSLLPQELGHGSFGAIHSATIKNYPAMSEVVTACTREWIERERPCVGVQIIELGRLDEERTARVMDELECLIGVPRHENLTRAIGSFAFQRKQLWMVTDSCVSREQASTRGAPVSLADFIKEAGGKLPINKIRRAMQHIVNGLEHLHEHSWIHLNVHTRSILYDTQADVYRVSSYKSVQFCQRQSTHTPPPPTPISLIMFVPPEHHPKKGQPSGFCSHKSDIFALGMCGRIMAGLNSAVPTAGSPDDCSYYSFLRCCLDPSPSTRYSALSLNEHPFLAHTE